MHKKYKRCKQASALDFLQGISCMIVKG